MATAKSTQILGNLLVEYQRIKPDDLQIAVDEQKKQSLKEPLGEILIRMQLVKEEDIAFVLGVQFNLPVVDLSTLDVGKEAIEKIPAKLARRLGLTPVFLVGKELTVAVADPTRIEFTDFLAKETGCTISPVVATRSQIRDAQNKYYAGDLEGAEGSEGAAPGVEAEETFSVEKLRAAGKDATIITLVNQFISQAIEENSSDIHLEPCEDGLLVRFRVDGMLREVKRLPVVMRPSVVSRIKILANLDIAERGRPQDGRIQVTMGQRQLDLRVNTLPTVFGEKVVMRILDRASILVELTSLGFTTENLERIERLIREPYGIFLVTGPTGSGKSTSLYSILNALRRPEVNIVTVEDPVEYRLPGINQVQVNAKKDLDFAAALRAILRQDPNVIMVGEIRDPETGIMATEAALTGHLVLATLHTNDAVGSVVRLTEMGIDPFLIAPSLLGVLAQRLVRKVCEECRENYVPSDSQLKRLNLMDLKGMVRFSRGKGCELCKGKGYKGRMAIHEVLVLDLEIRRMISERNSHSSILAYALGQGFSVMRVDAIKKLVAGKTSFEEVLRVTK